MFVRVTAFVYRCVSRTPSVTSQANIFIQPEVTVSRRHVAYGYPDRICKPCNHSSISNFIHQEKKEKYYVNQVLAGDHVNSQILIPLGLGQVHWKSHCKQVRENKCCKFYFQQDINVFYTPYSMLSVSMV